LGSHIIKPSYSITWLFYYLCSLNLFQHKISHRFSGLGKIALMPNPPDITRSKAPRQSSSNLVIARNDAAIFPNHRHCEKRNDVAINTHPSSLREAKRRGNPPTPCHCEEQSDVAIHPPLVIARSKATWQSTPTHRHCEEQSDVAIHPPLVIARSKATWQSTHPLSLRGAKRRGNPPTPCHCEEQSDVAIHTHPPSLRGAKRRGNPPTPCHCEEQSDVAIHPPLVIVRSKATWQSTPTPVIARSKATWQSIFQVVQDDRWIASPLARNDHSLLSLRGAKRRGNPYFR